MFRQIRAIFLRLYTVFQELVGADHSLEVCFFSAYHVLCDTLFDAMMDHAWDLGIGSSLLRIEESTI